MSPLLWTTSTDPLPFNKIFLTFKGGVAFGFSLPFKGRVRVGMGYVRPGFSQAWSFFSCPAIGRKS